MPAKASDSPAKADTSARQKIKVYQYRHGDGPMVFSDTPPGDGDYSLLLYDCFACKPDSRLDWHNIRLFGNDYRQAIARAARSNKLEAALIRAVIHAESAFDTRALSRTGAMGLMQLMPATAEAMGVKDAFQPEQNIQGGSRYLAKLLRQFDGDIALACAAYNAGPTAVRQYRGVPPYPETLAYVERVQILLQRYRKLAT
ncbi:lytic transglycosylase domain-containing protein [Shewanella sp. AS16]|uniref:lytic transglycosylase domain-containing protein n=1 Tax=Shewanella sp. AS16 TaxID=2907625 RepID=UPI001F2D4668|nr:lytic transglycosylase domain-containing protein [Shewanella sp. AS16]MCE9686151.1 lytic transglycosylase domain-containing protein [Shewanella sp. AS16]